MIDCVRNYLTDVGDSIGAEFHLVGGAVRDHLLGVESSDWDAVAQGLEFEALIEAMSQFGGTETTGEQFNVIRHFPSADVPPIEIALPRREHSTGVRTQDFEARYDPHMPIEDDLARRDFTINSIALRCRDREFIDPHDGTGDLQRRVLRMLHGDSAKDDPLRIIRGIRFIARLGLTPTDDTDRQLRQHVDLLEAVSRERFQKELLELLTAPHVDVALRYMQDIGALARVFPELQKCVGCQQNKYHDFDVWEHTVRVVANTPSDDPYVRMAALLHDVAKPVVKWAGTDGEPHFYEPDDDVKAGELALSPTEWGDHEQVGASIAWAVLSRLRFSTHHRSRVATLVREHMFPQGPRLGPKAARRLLSKLEGTAGGIQDNMEALFQIRLGDLAGGKTKGSPTDIAINMEFREVCRRELARDTAFTVRDLAVNGHDLMAEGLQGEAIGKAQKWLLALVIDDPQLNTREQLLRLLAVGNVE